jgi:hypothetical protein
MGKGERRMSSKEEYGAAVMRRLVLFSLFTSLGAFIHFYNIRNWHKPSSIELSVQRKFDVKKLIRLDKDVKPKEGHRKENDDE